MPPPQHLLASKIRGFVCRSCLSKQQFPRRQRLQWVSRNLSTKNEPLRQKGARRPPKSVFKEPTETIDEAQAGMQNDHDDIDILEALKAERRERRYEAAAGSSGPRGMPKPVVRYFEETPDGVRTELPNDLDEEANLKALENELGDMEPDLEGFFKSLAASNSKEIPHGFEAITESDDRIKAQLKDLEESDFGNLLGKGRFELSEGSTMNTRQEELPASQFSSKERSVKSQYKALEQSELSESSAKEGDEFRIPLDAFPVAQRSRIEQLNQAIQRPTASAVERRRGRRQPLRSSRTQDQSHVQRAWNAYSLCRHALMSSDILAANYLGKLWTILWNIFQVEGRHNLDRMARIKTLGDDICRTHRANYIMRPDQMLLHMEAEFIEGSQDRAIDMWSRRAYRCKTLGDRQRYWELGARMYAQNGQPAQALKAAETLVKLSHDLTNFRILLPIIRAYLRESPQMSVRRAWAVYIRLRVGLGSLMTMDDYDAITSSFLSANQPDLALGVFKDMMLTGQPSMPNEDSTALYKTATDSHDTFASLAITDHELQWQESLTLSQLPARFNNKFFFGKWLKKLIGEGELSAAQQVFELMVSRRIQPSAIHLNGLIGAWFREGSEKSRGLAEDMAWKMIKARTEFVEQRNSLDPILRFVDTKGLPSHISISPTVPATIETFCILISQYRRRQKADRMSDLFQAFEKSHIQPNTSFLNELLLTNTRAHDQKSAFETYQIATEEQDVPPNFDTYRILWGLSKKEVDPVTGFKNDQLSMRIEKCRGLFADMVNKLSNADPKPFPRDLYQLIVQTFSLAQDLAGTAIAICALQRRFNMYPEPETARVVVLQLARLNLVNGAGIQPRRLNISSSITRERVANVTGILQRFKDQRVEALRQEGIDFEQLTGDAKLAEPLLLLSNLLHFAAQMTESDNALSAANMSSEAAKIMGVPDCIAWESHKDSL